AGRLTGRGGIALPLHSDGRLLLRDRRRLDLRRRGILLEGSEVGQLSVDVLHRGARRRSEPRATLGRGAVGLPLHPAAEEERRDTEDRDQDDDRGEVPRLQLKLAVLTAAFLRHLSSPAPFAALSGGASRPFVRGEERLEEVHGNREDDRRVLLRG